jgi:peptidase E
MALAFRSVKQSIHLTGGGPGAMLALRRHFKSALAGIDAKHAPVVAYVGVASNDNAGFFAMIRAAVSVGTKARLKMAKLASPRASASDARALLESCDLVFVSGGDVDHGMKILNEKNMAKPLRTLAAQGKPMFGISAGSIMLARDWVRFPEGNEAKPELFPCLGIAPLHADAHAEADDWGELRVLVDLVRRRGDAEPLGFGLTRKGGVHVEIDGTGIRVNAIGTPIPRIGVRRGKVTDLAPLALTR